MASARPSRATSRTRGTRCSGTSPIGRSREAKTISRYLVRRLFTAVPTLILISFVLYAILSLAPGDPLSQFAANPAVPPEVRENIRRSLGLDQPWPIRYVKWVFAVSHGDWGFSFGSRIPVWDLLKLRIPSTLAVVGIAYLVSLVIAIPIGIIS